MRTLHGRMTGVLLVLLFVLAPPLFADDGVISFAADRMSGSSGKKGEITVLSGSAKVTVGSLSITADKIELSGADYRYVKALGGVKGEDSENGFSFSADTLDYDRETQVASFTGNASLNDSKNKADITASIISYNRTTEIAILQVNVTLKRENISCSSGFALYRRKLSLLDLSGSPLVTRGSDEFRADRITVNIDTEHIVLDGSVSGTLKDEKKDSP